MKRRGLGDDRGSALALTAGCLAVMVAAVAFVVGQDLVPDAPRAMAKVAGAGLVAAGFLNVIGF